MAPGTAPQRREAAADAAGELYGYGRTNVLFKPTKAAEFPFRPSASEAMSYFVGGAAAEGERLMAALEPTAACLAVGNPSIGSEEIAPFYHIFRFSHGLIKGRCRKRVITHRKLLL